MKTSVNKKKQFWRLLVFINGDIVEAGNWVSKFISRRNTRGVHSLIVHNRTDNWACLSAEGIQGVYTH